MEPTPNYRRIFVRTLGAAVSWGLVTFTATALADDLEVDSVIIRVTVFQNGAELTRSASMSIPAGEHRLILSDLPAGIDTDRLQIHVDDPAVVLGTLAIEESHQGELVSAVERTLQAELDQLQFERLEISDRIDTANTQLKLLDSLAAGTIGGQNSGLSSTDLTSLLDGLATSSNSARQVVREAGRELVAKDQEIEQKRFELSQVATRQRLQQLISIAVENPAASSTTVELTYPVRRAGWQWQYAARLDTDTRQLTLERKVSVQQASGEDWNNVELTITTADTDESTLTPELDPLYVDFFRPQQFRQPASAPSPVTQLSRDSSTDSQEIEEVIVTGSFIRSSAAVYASRYLVNFRVPGLVSFAADSQPQVLPIDLRGIEVDLITRAVPEVDRSAYLEARFTLESDDPIQQGQTQFYRDGTFIGSRSIAAMLPGQEISLPFGRDDRIQVEVIYDEEDSRDGGTFRRNRMDNERMRFRLTSFHPEPVELEVLARIPVSENQDIVVEIEDESTDFDVRDVDGFPGLLMWQREASAGEPIEILHYYSVIYPEGERLRYENR